MSSSSWGPGAILPHTASSRAGCFLEPGSAESPRAPLLREQGHLVLWSLRGLRRLRAQSPYSEGASVSERKTSTLIPVPGKGTHPRCGLLPRLPAHTKARTLVCRLPPRTCSSLSALITVPEPGQDSASPGPSCTAQGRPAQAQGRPAPVSQLLSS